MERNYGQFCGLARALELVGGRWTLLIVRDLLLGPRRFTDLQHGLPGIPTNILSSRLKDLEATGLVERRLLARAGGSVVYELTPYGREIDDALVGLGMWGARALARPRAGDFFNISSLAIALRGGFRLEEAPARDFVFELVIDDERVRGSVSDGRLTFPPESSEEPTVVLRSTPDVFADLLIGYETLDEAIAAERLSVEGPKREARRFFAMFRLPAPVGSPA